MTFLITGATGFIGRKLVRHLAQQGHAIHYLGRRRRPNFDSQIAFHHWDPETEAPLSSVPRLDAIIHLAGEPVNQRWTEAVKKRILDSRVHGTRNLVSAVAKLRHPPTTLISASAIGYYGDRGNEVLTEQSSPGSDFLAKVCVEWEAAALEARPLGLRTVPIRFGAVLGPDGGAFPVLARPARFGLAAKLGDGKQWMSWIHVDDLIAMIDRTLHQSSITGVLNGTAPEPVTNAAMTHELAHAYGRPSFLAAPKFALRAAMGEMSEFVLNSQRVLPQAALDAGFTFRYRTLGPALAQLRAAS